MKIILRLMFFRSFHEALKNKINAFTTFLSTFSLLVFQGLELKVFLIRGRLGMNEAVNLS